MRVLVVEDDAKLGQTLMAGLREEGYRVDLATDGDEADLFVRDRTYDVVVLDRLLPGLHGDELLLRWRGRGLGMPVLMLTALDTVADRVAGLRSGADDYLGKPFAFAELLARIAALTRRARTPLVTLQAGDLQLDPAIRSLRRGDRTVQLTAREYALLEVLFRHPGQVMSRDQLAAAAWDEPWEASANLIEAHVSNLRRKLALAGADPRCLRTVRGTGYRMEVGD